MSPYYHNGQGKVGEEERETWEERRKGGRERQVRKGKQQKASYDKKQDWGTCELLKLKRGKHLDPKCNFNVKSRLLRFLYIIIMIKCRPNLFVS